MEVTEVRIKKAMREADPNSRERLLAWASITVDGAFVVHNIRIVETDRGLAVFMPSRKMKDGEIKDIAHPLNIATRKKIETATLTAYRKQMEHPPSHPLPPSS